MVFYPSENNPNQTGGNNPSLPAFDLQSEKQRIGEGTEEIRQELLAIWQKKYATAQIFPAKLSSANPELIEFLLAFKNTLFYNDLAKKFSFSVEQRDALPQIIWNVSLAKNWYGLEGLLQAGLKINPSTAGQIAILVNQNILFQAKELGEKAFAPKRFLAEIKEEQGTEKISIQEAIKKYPELGEQLITSERIILTNFPGPVRPSIKNWLADYNFVMGYERERSGIERTTYLFHNINTQKLNLTEREHLSLILRSYDENYPLTVNKHTRQVVFPQSQPQPARIATPARSDAASSGEQSVAGGPIPRPSQATAPQQPARTAPPPRPVTQAPRSNFQAPARSAQHKNVSPPMETFFRSSQPIKPSAPMPQGKLEIKELPQAPKKEDANVHFTSPHTLPFEKSESGDLQPYRITPFGATSSEKLPEEKGASTKNVINLKE
ncbi:MAG TPA: hypothetical protein VF390_00745 [Patescibacteria group bacterium]